MTAAGALNEFGRLTQVAVTHPRDAFVIGDKVCDVELGRRAGSTTLLVRTGYGAEVANASNAPADYVVDDLREAARLIEGLLRKCAR